MKETHFGEMTEDGTLISKFGGNIVHWYLKNDGDPYQEYYVYSA